jgi:hypothetical protein
MLISYIMFAMLKKSVWFSSLSGLVVLYVMYFCRVNSLGCLPPRRHTPDTHRPHIFLTPVKKTVTFAHIAQPWKLSSGSATGDPFHEILFRYVPQLPSPKAMLPNGLDGVHHRIQ